MTLLNFFLAERHVVFALVWFLGSIRLSVQVVWYLRAGGLGVLISDLAAKFRMELNSFDNLF